MEFYIILAYRIIPKLIIIVFHAENDFRKENFVKNNTKDSFFLLDEGVDKLAKFNLKQAHFSFNFTDGH